MVDTDKQVLSDKNISGFLAGGLIGLCMSKEKELFKLIYLLTANYLPAPSVGVSAPPCMP